MRIMILSILMGVVVGCASIPPECVTIKSYLFVDPSCESGYRVPYLAGPAECLEMKEYKVIKDKCPNL